MYKAFAWLAVFPLDCLCMPCRYSAMLMITEPPLHPTCTHKLALYTRTDVSHSQSTMYIPSRRSSSHPLYITAVCFGVIWSHYNSKLETTDHLVESCDLLKQSPPYSCQVNMKALHKINPTANANAISFVNQNRINQVIEVFRGCSAVTLICTASVPALEVLQ